MLNCQVLWHIIVIFYGKQSKILPAGPSLVRSWARDYPRPGRAFRWRAGKRHTHTHTPCTRSRTAGTILIQSHTSGLTSSEILLSASVLGRLDAQRYNHRLYNLCYNHLRRAHCLRLRNHKEILILIKFL